jgi:hypothetical protein
VSIPVTSTAPEGPADAAFPLPPQGPNVFGIVALALAVLGFISGVIPVSSGFAWVLFVPAIVCAIIGLTRRGRPKKMALAGLLVAVAGWIVAIVVTVVTVVLGVGAAVDEFPVIPDTPLSGDSTSLGQPITNSDGTTFTLNGVQCGLTTTGDDFFAETPTGEWCRVDFSVANDGSEAVSLLAGDITGYAAEIAYEADDATGKFGEDYFTTDLNPGLSIQAVVFIDVPAGTALDTVAFAPVLSFSTPVLSTVG